MYELYTLEKSAGGSLNRYRSDGYRFGESQCFRSAHHHSRVFSVDYTNDHHDRVLAKTSIESADAIELLTVTVASCGSTRYDLKRPGIKVFLFERMDPQHSSTYQLYK